MNSLTDLSYVHICNSWRNDPTVDKLVKLIVYYKKATKVLVSWHISGIYWYIAASYDLDGCGSLDDLSGVSSLDVNSTDVNSTDVNSTDIDLTDIDLTGIYTNEEPMLVSVESDDKFHCIKTNTAKVFFTSNLDQDDHFNFIVESYLTKLELLDKIERQKQGQAIMLSNISHSIRTPLNGILHCTSLIVNDITNLDNDDTDNLDNDDLNETSINYTSMNDLIQNTKLLNQSAVLLATNIFDIIDLTKLSLGKLTFNKEVFCIRDVIDVTMHVINSMAKSANLQISHYIENSVPYYIYSDPTRIKQILINILENAVQHTERGTVLLHVDSTIVDLASENANLTAGHLCLSTSNLCSSTSNLYSSTSNLGSSSINIIHAIRFTIKDTGIGIDNETKETLFKPSELLINAKQAGTSLKVSHMLATALGGTLTLLQSTVNVGSTFELMIYAEEDQTNNVSITLQRLNGKKILFVTDTNIDIYKSFLAKYEINYAVAASYQEVYVLYKDFNPDLLVVQWSTAVNLVIKALKTIISAPCLSLGASSRDFDYYITLTNDTNTSTVTPVTDKVTSTVTNNLIEVYDTDKTETLVLTFKNKLMEIFNTPVTNVIDQPKILIVEDEYINRVVLEKLLNKLGYNLVDVATNGKHAIQLIGNVVDKYDLYLIDIRMPNISGFELSDYIHRLNPAAKMLGVTAQIVIDADIRPWFNTFIYKPIDVNDLEQKITQMLNV